MEFCHTDIFLHSNAAQLIAEFIQKRHEQWATSKDVLDSDNFESFEQEIHELIMALESELVGDELGRYDLSAKEIEIEGKLYQPSVRLPETYLTSAGRVRVERTLYTPVGGEGKSICPLELRSGIIGGYFTPRAARQGAYMMALLTPGESEKAFGEIGNMQPSRSSLDRLTKVLSPHWEEHREAWEAQLRQTETIPASATVMAISVDGVMAPMRNTDDPEKTEPARKRTGGPKGYKEVGCGTVTLYNPSAERLQTVRYARMPESKKVTLQQQLETESASILALNPDLLRVHLADGAKDNWRLMNDIEAQLPVCAQAPIEIVDYYHACDHLKKACDAAWGENSSKSNDFFDRLKSGLKEHDSGADRVIRTLRFQVTLARGHKRERLETELTYFNNQRPRMDYADYIRRGLPIASGVMEAACKTLVTQRLKRSGMVWTHEGGQAILTLRSLIQSDRWHSGWTILSADFRIAVNVSIQPETPNLGTRPSGQRQSVEDFEPTQPFGLFEYAALCMAS